MNLVEYEFTCPFCNKNKITFISDEKLEDIKRREKLIQEIFNPQFFPATYREIFVSKICSSCQVDVFDSDKNEKPFDVNIGENTTELESRISEMYENAR